MTGIFGMDLSTSLQSTLCKENWSDEPLNVPPIVTECIIEIEARGLTMEGIYRVPGSHEQIDSLRLAFERGRKEKMITNVVHKISKLCFHSLRIESWNSFLIADGRNVSLDEKSVPDINVVAGLLKLYFRLLPLRLITSECFRKLMDAHSKFTLSKSCMSNKVF